MRKITLTTLGVGVALGSAFWLREAPRSEAGRAHTREVCEAQAHQQGLQDLGGCLEFRDAVAEPAAE